MIWSNALEISIRTNRSIVLFRACVSLLIFCLSIHRCEWGIKVSHYYCVIVNFPFHTCLAYCSAPILGAYIFIIVISSSWIDPLIFMNCPSLSLFKVFISKSVLSDMSTAMPAFFWSPFV